MLLLKSILMPIYMVFYRFYEFMRSRSIIGNGCSIRRVNFGKNCRVEDRCRVSGTPFITTGKNFYLNAGCHLLGDIEIGNEVMIGPQTIIWGRDHGMLTTEPMIFQPHLTKKIVIEDDVWIGANVTILKGIKIARGTVVAAGAVVTKDTEPYSIVAGIPARMIANRMSKDETLK